MTKFRDQQGRIHRLGGDAVTRRGSRPGRNAAPAPGAFDGRSIDDKLAEIGEIIEELERSPALKDLLEKIDPIERAPVLQEILGKLELADTNIALIDTNVKRIDTNIELIDTNVKRIDTDLELIDTRIGLIDTDIEKIDLNAVTLLEDIVRSTHFLDVNREYGSKI